MSTELTVLVRSGYSSVAVEEKNLKILKILQNDRILM